MYFWVIYVAYDNLREMTTVTLHVILTNCQKVSTKIDPLYRTNICVFFTFTQDDVELKFLNLLNLFELFAWFQFNVHMREERVQPWW